LLSLITKGKTGFFVFFLNIITPIATFPWS